MARIAPIASKSRRARVTGTRAYGNRGWQGNNQTYGNQGWQYQNRQTYRGGYAQNYQNNNYRGNNQRWDRDWRHDNRYNWQSYRNQHRSIFSNGDYYAPYRNYSYRSLSIGFSLNSLFYSNRYWIQDPWQYRLPEVYGPYRWVRYYDDVVLVNIYNGEVVDVIRDFFW